MDRLGTLSVTKHMIRGRLEDRLGRARVEDGSKKKSVYKVLACWGRGRPWWVVGETGIIMRWKTGFMHIIPKNAVNLG